MYFNVSFKRNGVCQAYLVEAGSIEEAEEIFSEHKTNAEILGISEQSDISEDIRKGKQIIKREKR